MAGTLPPVRGGHAPALYPVQRSLRLPVAICRFMNGKEQRWKQGSPLNSFALRYVRINVADISSLQSFIIAQKGMFDSTWSMTLDDTYDNLGLDSDAWSVREESRSRTTFSLEFRASQTQNNPTIPALGASYPNLASGAVSCYPFELSPTFNTLQGRNPIGPRYSFAYYGAGLSGFPTGPLNRVMQSYIRVSDTDLATYVNFFLAAGGSWSTFAWSDPASGSSIAKARFDQESLDITYEQKNASSFTVRLAQVP